MGLTITLMQGLSGQVAAFLACLGLVVAMAWAGEAIADGSEQFVEAW